MALASVLLILSTYIAFRKSENITCDANQDCIVNCTEYDTFGCKGDIIDATTALSLSVLCDSQSPYNGGCQYAQILCPDSSSSSSSSLCNINCIDYYGCYLSTIYSSINTDLNIICDVADNSCSKTILYANYSNSLNISCYGSGVLSISKAVCSNINVYASNIQNKINIKCDGDYSCSYLFVNATNANIVNLYSRGKYAMYYGSIYAENANSFNLFCGSEQSEYGCYHTSIYIPPYISYDHPRAHLKCEGHGCYNKINIYAIHGALDLNISLNGCNECDIPDKCVDSWTFYCGTTYSQSISFYGEVCDESSSGDICDCKTATNIIRSNYINNNEQCDIFEADYICKSGEECIIDCSTAFKDGCYDKIIDAASATSLLLKCTAPSSSSYNIYGGCESNHIYCPKGNECHIECWETNSCDNTEINSYEINGMVNLTCITKDSCSSTTIYGENTDTLLINCIETDSCNDLTVYGQNANNLSIFCQGDSSSSSYSSCHLIKIYANYSNTVMLKCKGDYSCYQPHIEAFFANKIIIEAIGENGIYYGEIYGNHVKESMNIMCKSEYSEYGCKNTKFYIPSKTNIQCEGHGCYYLDLYAQNGFNDITNLTWNGCGQCSSFDACLYDWTMHCGDSFATTNYMYDNYCSYDKCGCNKFRALASDTFNSDTMATQCDIFNPDIECEELSDYPYCNVSCSTNCNNKIISGGNQALSITVRCDKYESCYDATIICPTTERSECNIICTNSMSCSGLTIYGATDGVINIYCDYEGACKSINIYGDDAYRINYICSPLSCSYTKIYASNAANINIDCIGSYRNYYSDKTQSCYHIQVQGENIKNTTSLRCNGGYACYDGSFHFDNANNAVITASGKYGMYKADIYTNNASSTTITCIGRNGTFSGCYNSVFYLNPKKTNLNCIGYGCYDIQLKTIDGFNDLNQIALDGCGECLNIDDCIGSWTVYCNGYNNYDYNYDTDYYSYSDNSGYSIFDGISCDDYNNYGYDTDHCQCSHIIQEVARGWRRTDQYQCTKSADYECKDVNIDCAFKCDSSSSDCSGKTFAGLNASSLSVSCDYRYGSGICSNALIYCPETSGSDCNIRCIASDSCQGVKVESYTNNNINIICDISTSCTNMIIYGSNADHINIKCNGGTDGSSYRYGACYGLQIYDNNAASVSILCNGSYSCYDIMIHINNANNIDITVNDYSNAITNGVIYASNATVFNLYCSGTDGDSWTYYNNDVGCYDLSVYLPEMGEINLNCKGTGCESLSLYKGNGFNDINSIKMDLCGCDSNTIESCISSWSLYCDENGFDSWSSPNYYYGDYCSANYDNCDCQELSNIVNAATIKCSDDFKFSEISTGGWVGIVIGIILIVGMLTIYCQRCRKRRKQRRRRRNGEDEHPRNVAILNAVPFNEGESEAIQAQEIALQPISYVPLPDNIQQQIQDEEQDEAEDEEQEQDKDEEEGDLNK